MTPGELERRIREGIPISAHMGFRILELSLNAITVEGGGAENVNVHGTAFAGSLYAVSALAVWGLVHSRLPDDASLVMAQGGIEYFKPVVGDIIARCEISNSEMEDFLQAVNGRGKGRLQAIARVRTENGETAAQFSGQMYARLARHQRQGDDKKR